MTFGLCCWLWLGQPGLTWAAIAAELSGPGPQSAAVLTADIPSEKVSQFVAACLQVVALIERREGELQAAEAESESLRIQQDIEAEAVAIIQLTGLTRLEYLQLLGLANVDAEFGERIAALLQEGTG